jgi:hypothetical protein
MTDEYGRTDAPLEGAPTWVRVLQAAIVGIIAGLALHVLLSMVVLQGREILPRLTAPAQCKKSAPAHDAGSGAQKAPAVSSLRWTSIASGG